MTVSGGPAITAPSAVGAAGRVGSTTMLRALVAVAARASCACTVNVTVPVAVGVPLMTPAALSVSPAGNAPADTDQVYGVLPPVAASVWL